MKKGLLRARIVIYAVLVVAIGTVWVTVSVLNAPVPILPDHEIAGFDKTLTADTRNLLARRSEALSELESVEGITPAGSPDRPEIARDRPGFETLRNLASRALMDEIGRTAPLSLAGILPVMPEMNEAITTADKLYEECMTERSVIGKIIFTRLIDLTSEDYVRHLGYFALAGTVARDLIPYRTLGSLQLQEIKLILYQTEAESIAERLDAWRWGARLKYDDRTAELDARYDVLVAQIVHEFGIRWTEQGFEIDVLTADMSVLEDIRIRLGEMTPAGTTAGYSLEPGDAPDIDRENLLADEWQYSEDFERVTAGNEDD